jgi:hypothetical protein
MLDSLFVPGTFLALLVMLCKSWATKPITTSQNKKKALCLSVFVVFFPFLRVCGRGVLSTTKAQRHEEGEGFVWWWSWRSGNDGDTRIGCCTMK